MDALLESSPDESFAGIPIAVIVCDEVFHASTGIDFHLTRIDRASEALIVLASIFAIAVALWVVNMLDLDSLKLGRTLQRSTYTNGKITSKTFDRDFELVRRVSMSLIGEIRCDHLEMAGE
jgi:hypothetical protein